MIHRETAAAYHARKAVSAGFLWDMVKPDGCPAYAFARSVFNPHPLPQKQARELDVGTAAHLAVLEPKLLEERIAIIEADSYRTKDAQAARDLAIFNKRVPLLATDYDLLSQLRKAIESSQAAKLFFDGGGGESEVSYTWQIEAGRKIVDVLGNGWVDPGLYEVDVLIEGKARADRITPHAIVDLKTASSASPEMFQRAMDRDGHHLRAAWYLDGWNEQYRDLTDTRYSTEANVIWESCPDYLFVVVAKEPPHIVSIFSTGNVPDKDGWFHIKEETIDKGRMLYISALAMFRRAQEAGVWPGYSGKGENKRVVSLPAYRLNQLYAQERAGEFDEPEDDIPY